MSNISQEDNTSSGLVLYTTIGPNLTTVQTCPTIESEIKLLLPVDFVHAYTYNTALGLRLFANKAKGHDRQTCLLLKILRDFSVFCYIILPLNMLRVQSQERPLYLLIECQLLISFCCSFIYLDLCCPAHLINSLEKGDAPYWKKISPFEMHVSAAYSVYVAQCTLPGSPVSLKYGNTISSNPWVVLAPQWKPSFQSQTASLVQRRTYNFCLRDADPNRHLGLKRKRIFIWVLVADLGVLWSCGRTHMKVLGPLPVITVHAPQRLFFTQQTPVL